MKGLPDEWMKSLNRINDPRLTDPVLWSKTFLGFEPDEAQSAILRAIEPPGARVVVESSNGSGKTAIAAIAVLRHLERFGGKVVTMSGGERQVNTQLWNEIRIWVKPLLNCHTDWAILTDSAKIKTGNPEIFALGFGAEEPGRVEGWHSENLLFVVDEAKAVKDKIWNAIDSTLTQAGAKLLIVTVPSSPKSYPHKRASMENTTYIRIIPRQVGIPASPPGLYLTDRVSDTWIREMETTYGKDSAIYKRRVLAIASHVSENPYFNENDIRRMFDNYNTISEGNIRGLSVDWGRRVDYTVVSEWRGLRARIVMRTQKDYMEVIGQIKILHDKNRYSWIIADEGEGRGQIDRMKELHLPVEPFNFGSSIDGTNAKLLIMSTLHTGMEIGELGLKHSMEAEEEFMAFQSKPTSEGRMKFEAAEGFHDDIVCSIALGYWSAKKRMHKGHTRLVVS